MTRDQALAHYHRWVAEQRPDGRSKPAKPDGSLLRLVAALRAERERQGLSLADVSGRAGLDEATLLRLDRGIDANPAYLAIRKYARALGKLLDWRLEDVPASGQARR
jgi:hypothetical protein